MRCQNSDQPPPEHTKPAAKAPGRKLDPSMNAHAHDASLTREQHQRVPFSAYPGDEWQIRHQRTLTLKGRITQSSMVEDTGSHEWSVSRNVRQHTPKKAGRPEIRWNFTRTGPVRATDTRCSWDSRGRNVEGDYRRPDAIPPSPDQRPSGQWGLASAQTPRLGGQG